MATSRPRLLSWFFFMVPRVGLEPTRTSSVQGVLSPSSLPIPPPRQKRPGRESNPRLAVLQTAALATSPPGQPFSILYYFSSFFNFSKISSTLLASAVFLSSRKRILGTRFIFSLLFSFCWIK